MRIDTGPRSEPYSFPYIVRNGQPQRTEVVITGYGVLSPIGIGNEPFWRALCDGVSGIRLLRSLDTSELPVHIGAEILDFDPKLYVRPRKSLKVMARDTQFGVAAADLACQHAGLAPGKLDPDRMGVVFGADSIATEVSESINCYRRCMVEGEFDFNLFGSKGILETYPLLFLKILPNMIASHIAIAQDARGPNNTIHQGDVSSLLAIGEAVRAIERGVADVMIAGGSSSHIQPVDWVRASLFDNLATESEHPEQACRPFDAHHCGQVRGEGAAALVLESRSHAVARGATIRARIAGTASANEPYQPGKPLTGRGLRLALQRALADAELSASEIGLICAHGSGAEALDRVEAVALHEVFGDTPVTALKSYFGNLSAAGGAVEAVACLLALEHGLVPPTLNYDTPDPACPINVVHGGPLTGPRPTAVINNLCATGQAAAVVLT